MNWYYSDGGKQVGPIDETELNRLVTLGTVRSDTLVWHDGLTSWQPLGVVRGMPPAAAAAAGRHYGGFWIRFLARVIDGILLGVINAIVRLPLHADVRHRDGAACAAWAASWRRLDFCSGDDGRAGPVGADRASAGRGL